MNPNESHDPVGARSPESERQLVSDLRRGREDALDRLHRNYADTVYRFVFYRLAGHVPDVEEVVQETFLAALKSLHRFRGDSQLSTWLCGIAKNQIHATRRQQRRLKLASALESADEEIQRIVSLGESELPDDVLEREETQDLVGATLASLPESYQNVLRRKYYESTPVKDIARGAGTTPKSVESLLTRARIAFRRTFELLAGHLSPESHSATPKAGDPR